MVIVRDDSSRFVLEEYMEMESIDVLIVKPGKFPERIQIENCLKPLQECVEGFIEVIQPFEDQNVALICNEEGKINGLPFNRALYDEDGDITDFIAGSFLLVGVEGEDFISLNKEQLDRYEDLFHEPEVIRITDAGKVVALSFDREMDDASLARCRIR